MTHQIGHSIIHLQTIDSTNNYVAKLFNAGKINHGSVIMADEQTAGRGQRQKKWDAEPGKNLLCSFYLKPANLSVDNHLVLSHITSLALVDLLRKYHVNAAIKWPNDIYVNHRKIAGILIENSLSGMNISHSIIGIGFNVNQQQFEHPLATSMLNETGNKYLVRDILMELLQSMNNYWNNLENKQYDLLNKDYLEQLYLKNIPATFSDIEGQFTGTIRGVNEKGLLLVEKLGNLKAYDLQEITLIAQNDV